MVAKVAGGVFIGIIAAFIVLKSPGWIKDWIAANEKANAESAVLALTPETLIARCGKPLKDETSTITNVRRITYEDPILPSTEWTIEIRFLEYDKKWSMFAIQKTLGDPLFDPRSQVRALPCLANR